MLNNTKNEEFDWCHRNVAGKGNLNIQTVILWKQRVWKDILKIGQGNDDWDEDIKLIQTSNFLKTVYVKMEIKTYLRKE